MEGLSDWLLQVVIDKRIFFYLIISSDEVVSTLSTSIRELVVEWMNDNMDVINCILNCGNPDCGGGNSENSAGTGGGISAKVIRVMLL